MDGIVFKRKGPVPGIYSLDNFKLKMADYTLVWCNVSLIKIHR